MSQQNPNKELTLNFNIELIKSNIDEMIKVGIGSYQLSEKNDIFNTYRIAIISGVTGGVISLSLTKIDDNTTMWKSEIMKLSGANTKIDNTVTLSRLQDEFLSVLSKGLSGEKITKESVKQGKTGGCLGLFIALISIPSALTYILLS